MEERLDCELAWKLNREKLIKMADRNTFLALATAFGLAWDLATGVIDTWERHFKSVNVPFGVEATGKLLILWKERRV